MKVLQEGNPNGWEIEQVCTGSGNGDGGCKARLLVAEDDIFVTTRTYYNSETEYFYTFECPCCGVKTDIPEKDIVQRVRQKAMEKYRANKSQ